MQSNEKDGNDETEMMGDERILAPGLTIVEDEGALTSADLSNVVPNESMFSFISAKPVL